MAEGLSKPPADLVGKIIRIADSDFFVTDLLATPQYVILSDWGHTTIMRPVALVRRALQLQTETADAR